MSQKEPFTSTKRALHFHKKSLTFSQKEPCAVFFSHVLCDMTRLYVWHGSFIWVTRLCYLRDMTRPYVHDSCDMSAVRCILTHVTWVLTTTHVPMSRCQRSWLCRMWHKESPVRHECWQRHITQRHECWQRQSLCLIRLECCVRMVESTTTHVTWPCRPYVHNTHVT